MINLLTPEVNSTLNKDFKLRAAAALLLALSAVLVIAVLLLWTIYSVLIMKERSLRFDREASLSSASVKDYEGLATLLNEADGQAKRISLQEDRSFSQVVSTVIADKNPGIKINNLRVVEDRDGGKVKISLRGTSLARSYLTDFLAALKRDKKFENVEAPLSSLISEGKSDFTLEFNLTTPKNERAKN